jgi:hypothetical protein
MARETAAQKFADTAPEMAQKGALYAIELSARQSIP